MDRIRIDQVVVVEDHGDLVCDFGQLVDQDPHQRLDGRHLRRTQRGQDPLADPLRSLGAHPPGRSGNAPDRCPRGPGRPRLRTFRPSRVAPTNRRAGWSCRSPPGRRLASGGTPRSGRAPRADVGGPPGSGASWGRAVGRYERLGQDGCSDSSLLEHNLTPKSPGQGAFPYPLESPWRLAFSPARIAERGCQQALGARVMRRCGREL